MRVDRHNPARLVLLNGMPVDLAMTVCADDEAGFIDQLVFADPARSRAIALDGDGAPVILRHYGAVEIVMRVH